MPAGAVVVVLLLNGLQIALPGPAFLDDGRVWVPVRAVLEAAGFQVSWDADRELLTAEKTGWAARIDMARARVEAAGQTHAMDAPPRRVDGALLVPAGTLRNLLFGVDWESDRRTLRLVTARFGGAGLQIRRLLDRPLEYLGNQVTVAGECGGPAESAGRSPDVVAWVLRDAYASITCHSPVVNGEIGWNPRYGLRVEVSGRLGMAADGAVHIEVTSVKELSGAAGVACELATDRAAYGPDVAVIVELYVSNPTAEVIDLGAARRAGLSVVDTGNRVLWEQWVSLPQALQPGEEVEYAFVWEPPDERGTGPDGARECVLEMQSSADLWAVRRWFRIGGQPPSAGRVAQDG